MSNAGLLGQAEQTSPFLSIYRAGANADNVDDG
jgi:hypothetical protein